MKFKATPNLFVKISNKYLQRVTGKKGFYFDDKGEYQTDNELLIKVLSQSFETVEEINLTKEENNVTGEEIKLTDEQIRAKAKEKGIKNWHNKKIENLIVELEEE